MRNIDEPQPTTEGNIPAQPVFVIGKNRSGTKWLSNLIANHPYAACIQREGAGGILEDDIFSSIPDVFGSLSIEENYLAFLACYSQNNGFLLMGLDKKVLGARRARDYFEFNRYIMDKYAEKEGKRFWLQKSSVENFERLYRAYPDARFVVIEREIEANIRSTRGLQMLNQEPYSSILRETASCIWAHKTLNQYQTRKNVFYVRFEQLRTDKAQVLQRVCSFLNIPYEEGLLSDRFEKNTSFKAGVEKDKILSRRELYLMRVFGTLLALIPYRLFKIIYTGWRNLRQLVAKPKRKFVRGSFALAKDDFGWKG
jgi:hypothetical protein